MDIVFVDERQDVQKKTFTKWINAHLSKTNCPPVRDLFIDLRDGHKLLALLEVLTNEKYKREKGKMRVHHINNLNKAMEVLLRHGVRLVNISSDDIETGSAKLTLGLIWLIASKFEGQKVVNSQTAVSGIEKSLLAWVQNFTQPRGIKVNDFTSSWSDGTLFLYILYDSLTPKFNLETALKQHPIARLRMAFDIASRQLQIDQLLDPEDVNTSRPDKKSILMYVMCLYHAIDSRQQIAGESSFEKYGSLEEMQLLDEGKDDNISETSENRSDKMDADDETPTNSDTLTDSNLNVVHVGNLTDLDEISLTKSFEDLSKYTVPKLLRTTTTTVTKVKTFDNTATDMAMDQLTPELDSDRNLESVTQFFFESHSRPISTATNLSIEIGGYQSAVEEVLTLLLEAEEVLSRELPIVTELSEAKSQYREYEDFMLKLAEHQQFVGSALEEGARLITDSLQLGAQGLTIEEQNEIKHQMFLLNERWETLRVRALDVQSRVHAQLAEVQLAKIEQLRLFLTNTEDRISRMPEIGSCCDQKVLENHIIEHENLQHDLEEQQKLVDSLSNLVVIVDDESGGFNDVEDRLSALGERWSHVVKWTGIRGHRIRELVDTWKRLESGFVVLTRWLDARERVLKAMEGGEVTEIGSVMKRIAELRYCERDLTAASVHLNDLDKMAVSIVEEDGSDSGKWLERVENLNDRCDALKQIIEIQQIRLESMGFKIASGNDVQKPENWIDYQAKFTSGILEDIDDERTTLVLETTTEIPQSSNKKRKLQKPEKVIILGEKIVEMGNFITNCEHELDDLARQSRPDPKKQMIALERLDSALKGRIEEFPKVRENLEECIAEFGSVLEEEEQLLSALGSRYDELNFRLEDTIAKLRADLVKEKFYKSLTGFKLVLADSRDWFQQHANKVTREELETRLRHMESLSPEIEEARVAMPTTITTAPLSDDFKEWRRDFDQFHESWVTMKAAIGSLIEEKGGINPELEEKRLFIEKLINNFDDLEVIVASLPKMETKLNFMNKRKNEYEELESVYNDLQRNPGNSSSIAELTDAWQRFPNMINERIIKQNTAIESLKHFENEYSEVVGLVRRIESEISIDVFIVGETKALVNRRKDYENYLKEFKKAEIDIISVKNFSEIIIGGSEKEHAADLTNRIQLVNDMYTQLINLHKSNLNHLDATITQTDEILSRIHSIELWLNDLEMNTPKVENKEIESSNSLFQIKSKFQSLKETCEQMTIKLNELNETGGEILLQIDDHRQNGLAITNGNTLEDPVSHLAKKFTKLNARWNEVTSLVYTRTALLEHVSSQLGEFKTLICTENGYLDKLEKQLRKSPQNAADAEEISEELDDLENYVRNHSEARIEKIQEIGKELVDLEIMINDVSAEVSTVVDRWYQLQHQAKQRAQMLEQAVSEAQTSETRMTVLHEWVLHVDKTLNEHRENDVTAQDLPHDFERLVEEFKNNEQILMEMKQEITSYREKGKHEAANRLQAQFDLIEERFKISQQKLERFTSAQAGFESRLNRAMGELRNIERSSCVLDVTSAAPSNVEDQLQYCVKMYCALSEVKAEIETVIKTGRRICEDKSTKNPRRLGQRIDTLKYLYNALGENVTVSKAKLEKLIDLANVLMASIQRIEMWLEVNENNDNRLKDTNEKEIADLAAKCYAVFAEYRKICDPVYLEDVKERIDDLNTRFSRLTSSDILKQLNEMKTTLQNMDNISLEMLRTMEMDLEKIETTSNPDVKRLHQQVTKIVQASLETYIIADIVEEIDDRKDDDNDETEIVVVSDTVRQRRSRTSTSTSSSNEKDTTLPDLLPPKTFRLAETSSLFSKISDNIEDSDILIDNNKEKYDEDNNITQDGYSVVAVREHNLSRKMMAQNVNIKDDMEDDDYAELEVPNSAKLGQIVDTISILESADHFEPEYVETVNIIDASEDTSDTDTHDGSMVKLDFIEPTIQDQDDESFDELEYNLTNGDVEIRNDRFIRVEKHRISFEAKKPKPEAKERDILHDSDVGLDETQRDSFYSSDKENFDIEPCEFSDDDDDVIPHVAYEMKNTTDFDSNCDTNRIEMPHATKPNRSKDNKLEENGASNDPNYKFNKYYDYAEIPATIEQRVEEFEKMSRHIIKKMDVTCDNIEKCTDGDTAIEHLKMSIAPDAATLISQGDTLIFETHGKASGSLSKRVMQAQEKLREKFREVKNLRIPENSLLTTSVLDKSHNIQPENHSIPKEKTFADKKFPTDLVTSTPNSSPQQSGTKRGQIHFEELTKRVLKRINDLIAKPLNDDSEIELKERILEIRNQQEDLKLATDIAAQEATPSPRAKATMESLEKAKNNLSTHCDTVVSTLAQLNHNRAAVANSNAGEQPKTITTTTTYTVGRMPSADGGILASSSNNNSNREMTPSIERDFREGLTPSGSRKDSITSAEREAYVPGSFSAKTKSKSLFAPGSVLATNFDKSVLQISDWLSLEREMLKTQSVIVGDIDGILYAIDKQKMVLRELEFKKPQLDELVHTAETLKTDANRQQLQGKVTRLREHWDETSQCVLQRKSQLAVMLGDSQRYEAKRIEIDTWLSRMENRGERMSQVATTADVLDLQQKDQKSFHAELHQYKHQIDLFNQLTQKLIAVYPTDDTSRIKRMTESVNLRYSELNNAVINRGKQLHAAVQNLQSFDRTMDQFLAWLSEAESLCENAESEIDRNPHILKVGVLFCTKIFFVEIPWKFGFKHCLQYFHYDVSLMYNFSFPLSLVLFRRFFILH